MTKMQFKYITLNDADHEDNQFVKQFETLQECKDHMDKNRLYMTHIIYDLSTASHPDLSQEPFNFK